MHSHKGKVSIDSYDQTTLMKMYFPFIQGAWWISFPPQVIQVWMNQSNLTIKLSSPSQPGKSCALHEIKQGRDVFYFSNAFSE